MVKFFKWKQNNKQGKHYSNNLNKNKDNNNLTDINKKVLIIETVPRFTNQLYPGSKKLNLENISYNINLIKSSLPDPNLTLENFTIGSRSKTQVSILYLKDIANSGIVAEIRQRISDIRAEIILDTSYIERNLENSNWSPFPQLEKTERPDVIISALTQGRVAILVDGVPDVLLAPVTFFDLLDTPDDAYRRWFISGSFFRIARFILFLMATFLPGLYIAVTSFHPELLPTILAFTINAAKAATPFPIYLEAFLLMGFVEAIRMIVLRFPNFIGVIITVNSGIALILTMLYANIVSAPIIIIATLTMIASFSIADFDLRSSVRMIQFFTMLMATVLGLFGLSISFFLLSLHLVTLKSFGIPYMAPVSPFDIKSWGHTILRENTKRMPPDETYK